MKAIIRWRYFRTFDNFLLHATVYFLRAPPFSRLFTCLNFILEALLKYMVMLECWFVFWSNTTWWLSSCDAGDTGEADLILGLGRSPGEGNGNPLQYSCLGNPMDRGAWRATVHGVAESWMWLSDSHFHFHNKISLTMTCIIYTE